MESEQEKDHNVADQTIEERLQTIQNSLFRHYSIEEGIALSHNWRLHQKSLLDADTFVYGEVDLHSFVSLMSNLREYEISVGENATFIDIGSGFGKLIIVATMLKLFKKAVGIEIVGSLHRRAVEMQALFIKNYRNPLDQCEMELFNGDGTYVDWSYAPFVFVHATTFDSSMMKRITATAQKMLVDAILMIVNNRLLDERSFELVRIVDFALSYGMGKLYIYRKMLRGAPRHEVALVKLKEVLNKKYSL